ncbi:MAG: hypothetical protein J0I20_33825 [Chloroflexi bacterium]|nr:hypothetical protein [Chloroflexota bacterium]OJW05558.1 MAG: hypothetical protein BGO39_02775 [Chloroflexi bacterium 54-19]
MPEINIGDIIEFFSPDDKAWLTGKVLYIEEKHNPGARKASEAWVKTAYLETPGLWEKKIYGIRLDKLKELINYGHVIQY